jgi:hypothetical protein
VQVRYEWLTLDCYGVSSSRYARFMERPTFRFMLDLVDLPEIEPKSILPSTCTAVGRQCDSRLLQVA